MTQAQKILFQDNSGQVWRNDTNQIFETCRPGIKPTVQFEGTVYNKFRDLIDSEKEFLHTIKSNALLKSSIILFMGSDVP